MLAAHRGAASRAACALTRCCPCPGTHVHTPQSPISVAGYPVGGDSLSITKGIVSRVSMVRYSQAGRLLGIQIDAAM